MQGLLLSPRCGSPLVLHSLTYPRESDLLENGSALSSAKRESPHMRPNTLWARAVRHGLGHQQRRTDASLAATSPASLIRVTDIPAPHTGSIRILSLNRPKARNAISRQLLTELSQQTNRIRDEGPHGLTHAVILASEVDSCFCAGADLKVGPSWWSARRMPREMVNSRVP